MDIQTRMHIVQLFLGLGVLGYGYLGVYRRTSVDRYREDLFTLRDDLFDYMWKNGISFDLPAYRLLRQLLNGAIRAAGTVTPWSFIAFAVVVAREKLSEDRLSLALQQVDDDEVRTHLTTVHEQFAARFVTFLFAEGFIGVLVKSIQRLQWVHKRARTFLYSLATLWSEPLVAFGGEQGLSDALSRRYLMRSRGRLA